MSLNAVSTHVPILDETNYREWAPQIKAYLLATSVWCIVDGTITCPPVGDAGLATWVTSDDMAQSNITLWLAVPIYNQVGATSADTWANLLAAFGMVGISCIYRDFKSLVVRALLQKWSSSACTCKG